MPNGTGKTVIASSREFRDNYDRIFGEKGERAELSYAPYRVDFLPCEWSPIAEWELLHKALCVEPGCARCATD